MTTMPEFNWSELQRSPVKIEKALNKHPTVRLKRRDASPLLLTKERDGTAFADLMTHLLAGIAAESAGGEVLRRATTTALPWLDFLTETDRVSFVAEFTKTLAACASVNEFHPLLVLVAQWQNTAAAIAAGVDLTSPIVDDAGDVPRPVQRGRGKRGGKK